MCDTQSLNTTINVNDVTFRVRSKNKGFPKLIIDLLIIGKYYLQITWFPNHGLMASPKQIWVPVHTNCISLRLISNWINVSSSIIIMQENSMKIKTIQLLLLRRFHPSHIYYQKVFLMELSKSSTITTTFREIPNIILYFKFNLRQDNTHDTFIFQDRNVKKKRFHSQFKLFYYIKCDYRIILCDY